MFAIVLAALDRSGSVLPILYAMGVHELAHVVMMLACGGRVRRLTLRFADLRIDAAGLGYRQELLAALGKYEDLYESVEAELDLAPLADKAVALGQLLELAPYGGWSVRLQQACLTRDTDAALAALAGPLVDLVCGALFCMRSPAFAAYSLMLGIYNLLPVWPLDGGRAVRCALAQHLPLARAEAVSRRSSFAVCAALLLAGIVLTFFRRAGLWPLGTAAYLTLRLLTLAKRTGE